MRPELVARDDADACLDKGKSSVLSSATLIARRKRMEIMRFKKLSRSMPLPLDDFSPVVGSSVICIKRPRIERATTTGSFLDTLEVNGRRSAWHSDEACFTILGKGQDAANLNDIGLLTHKSLPFVNAPIYVDGSSPNGVGTTVHASMSEEQFCNPLPIVSKDQESEKGSSLGVICNIPLTDAASSMDICLEGGHGNEIDTLATRNSPSSIAVCQEAVTSDLNVGRPDPETGSDNGSYVSDAVPISHSKDYVSLENQSRYRCPPCGKLLVCGRRREMEDTLTIAPSFAKVDCHIAGSCFCPGKVDTQPRDLHFFAVYDGHGGSQASTYCMERFHHALAEELCSVPSANEGDLDASEGPSSSCDWERVMDSCFAKVDCEVGGVCPNGQCNDLCDDMTCCGDSIAPDNVGTTAVIAVVSSCQIVVANCGDSRAVLSRRGIAIPLSNDHKPERDDETSRIEAAGGRVIYWDGYRVGGLLAVSRSIGDRYLKKYVVSKPEVICLQRTEDDDCLIIASDGLWAVIDNDTACRIARKCLDSSRKKRARGSFSVGADPASSAVAALLVKLAYGRGSKDNISVVVIDLKA